MSFTGPFVRDYYRKKERKKEIPYKEGKLKDIGSH